MDSSEAKILIKSLIGRLAPEGKFFELPGGRLSQHEVEALVALAGLSAD